MKSLHNIFADFLRSTAKPFLGKGYIDRYAPFLIPLFKKIYSGLAIDDFQIVDIELNKRIKVCSKDIGVGLPLIMRGSYEPIETKLFLDSVRDGATVVDVGANIGYYTILAGEKAGKNGKVYAFEPDANNLPLLRDNIGLNKLNNVIIVEKALSDIDGSVYFESNPLSKGDSSIVEKSQIKVESVRFDSYFKNIQVDVVKMDIEGAELIALEGGNEFFSRRNVNLFVEYNPASIKAFKRQPEELLSLLETYGYNDILIVDESKARKVKYSKADLNKIMQHTTFCNLMCKKNG